MKFNSQQKKAIEFYKGSCATVAGAGSGKCVKGDSLVITNKGLLQIDRIPVHFNVDDSKCEAEVYSLDLNDNSFNKNKTSHWFNMGLSKTIKITTSQGYAIEGTPEQPIIIINEEGNLEFKKLGDITNDDIVALNRSADIWGKDEKVSENMAYVFGLLIGDGYLASKDGSIGFTKDDPFLRGRYRINI